VTLALPQARVSAVDASLSVEPSRAQGLVPTRVLAAGTQTLLQAVIERRLEGPLLVGERGHLRRAQAAHPVEARGAQYGVDTPA